MALYAFGHITSIPPALEALYSVFSAAYPTDANGEAVLYWFGASLPAWEPATVVEITGIAPADQEPASLGPDYLREETFSVECQITVFQGMPPTPVNYLANMNAVWNVWIPLETAVANNPTLNGTVRYSEFGEMTYEPATDAKGLVMGTLKWLTRCSARNFSLS
jgi:hypothetical protein